MSLMNFKIVMNLYSNWGSFCSKGAFNTLVEAQYIIYNV